MTTYEKIKTEEKNIRRKIKIIQQRAKRTKKTLEEKEQKLYYEEKEIEKLKDDLKQIWNKW